MIKIHTFTQGSQDWKDARIGKLGGSSFHKILGRDTTLYKIVEDTKNPTDKAYQFSNSATDWGNKYESEAKAVYEVKHSQEVAEVGAIENSKYKHFLLSPDGIVKDSNDKIIGAIEIKCRGTANFLEFQEKRKIKKPARSQCIAYFIAMPTLQWVDYIEYNPRMRYSKNIEVVRLNRKDILEEIEAAENRLRLFIKLMED